MQGRGEGDRSGRQVFQSGTEEKGRDWDCAALFISVDRTFFVLAARRISADRFDLENSSGEASISTPEASDRSSRFYPKAIRVTSIHCWEFQ